MVIVRSSADWRGLWCETFVKRWHSCCMCWASPVWWLGSCWRGRCPACCRADGRYGPRRPPTCATPTDHRPSLPCGRRLSNLSSPGRSVRRIDVFPPCNFICSQVSSGGVMLSMTGGRQPPCNARPGRHVGQAHRADRAAMADPCKVTMPTGGHFASLALGPSCGSRHLAAPPPSHRMAVPGPRLAPPLPGRRAPTAHGQSRTQAALRAEDRTQASTNAIPASPSAIPGRVPPADTVPPARRARIAAAASA